MVPSGHSTNPLSFIISPSTTDTTERHMKRQRSISDEDGNRPGMDEMSAPLRKKSTRHLFGTDDTPSSMLPQQSPVSAIPGSSSEAAGHPRGIADSQVPEATLLSIESNPSLLAVSHAAASDADATSVSTSDTIRASTVYGVALRSQVMF